jgi:hypothetical protein
MVIAETGPQTRQTFNQVEARVKQQTQLPLSQILASLGSRHSIINFELKTVTVEQQDFSQVDPDAPPQQPGDVPTKKVKQPQQRAAFVWEVADEPAWQKLFSYIGELTRMAPGNRVQSVEEQGFTGWRLNVPEMPMGLLKGHGYLTLTLGKDVTSRTLNMLSQPPQGQQAMKRTPRIARAKELVPPRPGLMYGVTDYGRQFQAIRRIVIQSAQSTATAGPGGDEAQKAIKWMKRLIPSGKKLRDAIGVSASIGRMTDNGLVFQGALDLTAADQ